MYGILGFIAFVAAAWVLYDLWTKNDRLTDTEKLVWTIAAIAFNAVTAIVYYFTQKR